MSEIVEVAQSEHDAEMQAKKERIDAQVAAINAGEHYGPELEPFPLHSLAAFNLAAQGLYNRLVKIQGDTRGRAAEDILEPYDFAEKLHLAAAEATKTLELAYPHNDSVAPSPKIIRSHADITRALIDHRLAGKYMTEFSWRRKDGQPRLDDYNEAAQELDAMADEELVQTFVDALAARRSEAEFWLIQLHKAQEIPLLESAFQARNRQRLSDAA